MAAWREQTSHPREEEGELGAPPRLHWRAREGPEIAHLGALLGPSKAALEGPERAPLGALLRPSETALERPRRPPRGPQ